jgi:hypothetical protein
VVARWAVAIMWAERLHVRILPTHHMMDGLAVRLVRRRAQKGGAYVLMIADDLPADEFASYALEALAHIDPGGWRSLVAMRPGRRRGA